MKIIRRKTKVIKIGNIRIGGNNPIAIQSMIKAATADIEEVVKQAEQLRLAGCEIIRLAVKDEPDALALRRIKKEMRLPIVADIHFNWQLAIKAIDSGVDKIRLNPGNIYKKQELKEIAAAAKLHRIPIRVGVNSGSIRHKAQEHPACPAGRKSTRAQVDMMVDSALDYIKILEGFKFYDIVVSLKAADILDTVEACRKMSEVCAYPLHLGTTATGAPANGAIKSGIALGALLMDGIGDTIRVSLTDNPREEVKVARCILESLGLRSFGPEIISCPTCGRCRVDLVTMVKELEVKLSTMDYGLWTHPLKVAVMGCIVNGPGEARAADIGIAFAEKEGLLFKKGKAVRKVSFSDCADVLLKELEKTNGRHVKR